MSISRGLTQGASTSAVTYVGPAVRALPRWPGWTCPHVSVSVSVSVSAPRSASLSALSPAVPASFPAPPFPTPNVASDVKSPCKWLLNAGCSHVGHVSPFRPQSPVLGSDSAGPPEGACQTRAEDAPCVRGLSPLCGGGLPSCSSHLGPCVHMVAGSSRARLTGDRAPLAWLQSRSVLRSEGHTWRAWRGGCDVALR